MTTVLLLGALQSWFLVLLLATKRDRRLPDLVLTFWLGLIGAHLSSLYLHQRWGELPPFILQLNSAFPFLQGPLLYIYVDLLTSRRPRWKPSYLLHLLPFIAFLGYEVLYLAGETAGGATVLHQNLLSLRSGFVVWLLASVPLYVLASTFALRRYRTRLAATRSNIDRIRLEWLKLLVAGMGVVWLAVIATSMLLWLGENPAAFTASHLVFPVLTLFIYAIGYFGFRQAAIFGGPSLAPIETPRPEADNDLPEDESTPHPARATASSKYHKSGLGPREADELHERLLRLMKSRRPYLDPELTLGELAGLLGSPGNHVSQVINNLEGQSFYDFVNRYRVDAAASRLADPLASNSTVLDIAFDAGFGSKSTFNRIFRARFGMTPSQYRSRLFASQASNLMGPSG